MGCCCSKLRARVDAKYDKDDIIKEAIFNANLKGQKSQGCCQTQGNGALVLTRNTLWFAMLCCGIEIEIELRNITDISLNNRFMRYYHLTNKMLIINFTDHSGVEDAVAFLVPNPQEWMDVISQHRQAITDRFDGYNVK